MGAVPAEHSGMASAVNNDVARIAGLVTVAILPWLAGITGGSYLHPHALSEGFRHAVLIAGGVCAAGGVLAALAIRNPVRGIAPKEMSEPDDSLHCALDAPPLRGT
jgi:hypothetical protein